MPRSTIFRGLDDLPWSELKSFYGNASAVPALMRALASKDEIQQGKDLAELFNLVCHQADESQASAPCVPFLMELVRRKSTLRRDALLDFLQVIAIGLDFDMLALQVKLPEFLAEKKRQLAKLTERQRRELSRSPAITLACYDAVQQCVPDFIELLQDKDRRVRIRAAYNLAWFPAQAGKSLPRMRAIMRTTTNLEELSMAILSVGLLEHQADVARPSRAFVRPFLKDRREVMRFTAALYLHWHEPSEQVTDLLQELSQRDDYDCYKGSQSYLFAGRSWNQYAAYLLEN